MFITTFTGKKFHFDPELINDNEIDINDVAHSLSMQCRFNGHCKKFYSVAEHSYLVSLIIPQEFALLGLLDDAPEAYIGDITTPLKSHIMGFKALERKTQKLIYKKYKLKESFVYLKELKIADEKALRKESENLLEYSEWSNNLPGLKRNFKIRCWRPKMAKRFFMMRFNHLINEINRKD